MTREPIEVTRQDRIYCLKASSDYHSELCEECRFYPNCDHMTQDDMTELTIKDLEKLEQEPTTKNDLGVDCISRQAVIEFVCKNTEEILKDTMPLEVKLSDDYLYENIAKIMRNPKVLPSVTPQEPRKGHWIMTGDYFTGAYESIDYVKCSCCGEESLEEGNYCPNCGADMREVDE